MAFTSSDLRAVLPADYTFTAGDAGTHSFFVTLETTGMQFITATDTVAPSLVATETGVTVQAAAAVTLTVAGFPTTDTAGAASPVTVTAYDAYGNVATGYTGTVALSSNDQGAVLPADYTFTAADLGTHTFAVTLDVAGVQSISARDTANPSITGTQSGIGVTPAAASQLVFVQQPTDAAAGTAIGPAVTIDIEDAYGNLASSESSTVALTLKSGTFASGSSVVTAAASEGVATFTGLKIDTAGSYTAIATDGLLASSAASNPFTISPGPAARLVVDTQPSGAATTGQVFGIQPVIEEEDRFGNLETGDNSSVVSASLSSGTSTLKGTIVATVSGGVARFANLADDTSGTISITFACGALDQVTSRAINVAAGAATQLVVTTPPPDALTAGQVFDLVLSAEDPYGNLDATWDGNVTISIPGNSSFTTTAQARNGVAGFTGLMLSATADGKAIQAVASGLKGTSTNPLSVTPIAPPPTIISEQVVTIAKRNKKGKPVGKPVFAGFAIRFSTAMNAGSAGLAANYRIESVAKKRPKKNVDTAQTPVAFTSVYNASTNTVTLTIRGKQKFAGGGKIDVIASPPDGVASAAGALLDTNDTTFTILTRARGVRASL